MTSVSFRIHICFSINRTTNRCFTTFTVTIHSSDHYATYVSDKKELKVKFFCYYYVITVSLLSF